MFKTLHILLQCADWKILLPQLVKLNLMFQVFLGKLTRWLCIRGDVYTSIPSNDEALFDGSNATELPTAGRGRGLDKELTDDTPLPKSPTLAIEKTLDEIRRYLRICAAKTALPEQPVASHKQIVINEWHLVALVLDRVAMLFFVLLTAFIAIVMAMV